ncbi:MAG TPA: Flp pilus assembly protein CpaB [Vicinamibacterales bacterium]|jgi:pilus assembly protein CpaB
MGRVRVFIVLALAVTAGGVFAFGTYNYVQKLPKGVTTMPTKPVVIAASDLDVGAEISADNIKVIQWPQDSVPPQAVSDPKEVIGRGIITPVVQNEPIIPSKLSSKEAGAGLPPAIPPGLRALSVRVNEVIGVAGYVLPGTRVDVLATVNPSGNNGEVTSKVVLTNVQVLAAGTKIERDVEKNKAMPVSVVTLLVAPEESERLTLAATEGKIQLALRNPLDKSIPSTPGVRPSGLLGYASATKQAAARTKVATGGPKAVAATVTEPPAATVEIIRGDKRAHEIVRQEQ